MIDSLVIKILESNFMDGITIQEILDGLQKLYPDLNLDYHSIYIRCNELIKAGIITSSVNKYDAVLYKLVNGT